MFGLFRKGTLLGDELTAWQFDVFAWLLRHTGGVEALRRRRLILPTPAFFPQRAERSGAFAEAVFEQVRQHAGMLDWPCTLQAQDEDPDPLVAPTLLVKGAPQSPAGTFRRTGEGALITYSPAKASDPAALIATFAHELAHYRTADFPEPPPGGWDVWEPVTDLAAVFLGFGLFLANACFQFSQHQDTGSMGWCAQWQGYVSEPELLHMHAILATLLELPASDTKPWLKPSLHGVWKRVCSDVSQATGELEKLRGI